MQRIESCNQTFEFCHHFKCKTKVKKFEIRDKTVPKQRTCLTKDVQKRRETFPTFKTFGHSNYNESRQTQVNFSWKKGTDSFMARQEFILTAAKKPKGRFTPDI